MGLKNVLSAAGRAFIIAFGASVVTLSTGVSSAPNLDAAYALGVAALFASVAAGIKAIQTFIPSLSVGEYLVQPWGAWVDAFLQGFLGSLAVTVVGILDAPDLGASWKALAVSALVGALTAGLRALQGAVTRDEAPFLEHGA